MIQTSRLHWLTIDQESSLQTAPVCWSKWPGRRGNACFFATPRELGVEQLDFGHVRKGRNEKKTGGPGVSRTRDPSFRKRMLYPSELRGHVLNSTVWLRKCTPRFVLRGSYPPSAIGQPICILCWRECSPEIPPVVHQFPATEIERPGVYLLLALRAPDLKGRESY